MNLSDLIDISGKKADSRLKEVREESALPFFRGKGQVKWRDVPRKIVVVGSGIGGMASGALFAGIGHQVTVLERNPELIGGHGRCLDINGMRFSMGPQYVWDFGEGGLGDRFLRFLGIRADNPFLPMQADGFERIFMGERQSAGNHFFLDFKVPMGLENFCRELQALFPDESENLSALFGDMIAMFKAYKDFFRKQSASEGRFLQATRFMLAGKVPVAMKIKLGRTIYQSLNAFFDQYRISPVLRRVLYGHGGIFAENESEMSAIAYIVGTGNYHEGAWYPKHGFHHFFDSLAGVIEQAGGRVEKGRQVVRLERENHRIARAVCADGSFYDCDAVFSDISPRLTWQLLEKPETAEPFDYTPSHCVPACCIGVKGGLAAISAMRGRNYWWQQGCEVNYHDPDITAPPRMLFIGSPSANGFAGAADCPDDALVVFCPGNYAQEKTIHAQGREAVQRFKHDLAEDIVGILERNVFPGIKARLLFAKVISSIDVALHTGAEMGNAYGRRLSVDEILKGHIREENAPDNLYNVSATKNSPGIAGGIATAELIFKELTGRVI